MFKVLIAVDGSEHADRAIGAVARLARETTGTEVTLLNVNGCLPARMVLEPDQTRIAARSHQVHILENASALMSQHGLSVNRLEAASGSVAQEIVRAATDAGADQIVMGMRGMKSRGDYVLGSVAQKVLQLATVPVMLVK